MGVQEKLKTLEQAVGRGEMSPEELSGRLMAAIEAEYAQETPDTACIRACESLLRGLHAPGSDAPQSANARYLQAVREQAQRRGMGLGLRAALSAAAAVVLVVALLSGVRFTWFSVGSTPDGQQYILQGHEVSLETIQRAVADHDGETLQISVSSPEAIREMLGYQPPIPRAEVFGATYTRCDLSLLSGTTDVVVMFGHGPKDGIATYTWTRYEDMERLYFSIEQSRAGETVRVGGVDVYCTDNIERRSYLWVDGQDVFCLSGFIDDELAFSVIRELME